MSGPIFLEKKNLTVVFWYILSWYFVGEYINKYHHLKQE